MKNLILAFVLTSGLALAGCATPGAGPTTGGNPIGPIVTDPQITAIQQKAIQVCGYLPAVQTVAAIVATFTGGGALVGLVGNVADAICHAVTTNPLADGPGAKNYKPTVNGVRVQGRFL